MSNRSDNFNRSNSSSVINSPSDGGADWVTPVGTWGIISSKGYKSAPFGVWGIAYLEASSSSVDLQFAAYPWGAEYLSAMLRYVDSSNRIIVEIESTFLKVFKIVAGTYTQLGSTYSGTISAGDVIKVSVGSSNVYTVYQNGTLRITTGADSAHSTSTKHGVTIYGTTPSVDDFSITDTAGGGANFLTLSASSAASAAIAKAATSSKSATTTESATITRSVRLTRDATTTGTVTITKITAAIRLATATTTATLATIKAKLLTLTASVTNSATVRRAIGATRVATTTAAGTLARAISTTKAALTTASGTIGKVVATTKAAATASMATVATVKAKLLTLAASLSVSGAITKTIKITRSGAVSLLALLERLFISGGGGPAEIFAALTSKRSERNSDTSARPKAQAQRRPKQ